MDCIYIVKGECMAQPFTQHSAAGSLGFYKPNEEDQKTFCKNAEASKTCPRFTAYHEHLKAVGLAKQG